MIYPVYIQERAERHALGHFLHEWGDLSYAEVLEHLYDSDSLGDSITVWQPFEHMGLTELGENIEDLYAVFLAFGKEAFQIGEQSVKR